MLDLINNIIERDTYDSILYSVLGGLLLLSIYHMVSFLQNRDESYLLYSLYTLLTFLAYMSVTENGFLHDLSIFFNFDFRAKQFFTIIYNSLYFLFFSQFLQVKNKSETWYKIIVYPVYCLMIIATFSLIILKAGISDVYFEFLKKTFPFVITAQTIISFYLLTKVKNNLKYYIIFGGIVLFICSILGQQSVRKLPFLNLTVKMGDFIFYIGLLIENVAFSFALGHQQRIIYRDKVAHNKNLIAEILKNAVLNDKINFENKKRLETENDQIKNLREISDLKLSLLHTQMNPHFIFNALNSIKYYILENDTKNAVDYLTKFSKIIRTILVSSTVRDFTLEQQLQTIKVYVDLESLRYNKNIDFNITIDEAINPEAIKLPPMVLQPFIENAIVHGIALVEDKKINLHILQKSTHIEIRIIDNGIGRKEAERNQVRYKKLGNSLGTKIADGMLKNYFGDREYKIDYHDLYENDQSTGTMVVLEIPPR